MVSARTIGMPAPVSVASCTVKSVTTCSPTRRRLRLRGAPPPPPAAAAGAAGRLVVLWSFFAIGGRAGREGSAARPAKRRRALPGRRGLAQDLLDGRDAL